MTNILNDLLTRANPFIKATTGLDAHTIITEFIIITMVFAAWSKVDGFARNLFYKYYTCEIRIKSQDSVYAALLDFLDENDAFCDQERLNKKTSKSKPHKNIFGGKDASKKLAWYASPTRN